MSDVVKGRYSDVHLSSFITACATLPLDHVETVALTRVMVEVGDRLTWTGTPILDKHSVGGLPGDRTTPIVVSIVAAHGLTIPKTSSRAITSPAGTADAMETMAPVDIDLPTIRQVVEQEFGCIVWGGGGAPQPGRRHTDPDRARPRHRQRGAAVASVLSKKIAAGSSHLVLDVPVRSVEAAQALSRSLTEVASAFGIKTSVALSDGAQPVGRGIGPALEARDVLAVLQDTPAAPEDLKLKACALAGALLELGGAAARGEGACLAIRTVEDGRAWAKFQRICLAQGGMRTPPLAGQQHPLPASRAGRVRSIDNRRIAKLAKLAGAPEARAAGVELARSPGSGDGGGTARLHACTPTRRASCTLHSTMRPPTRTSSGSTPNDAARSSFPSWPMKPWRARSGPGVQPRQARREVPAVGLRRGGRPGPEPGSRAAQPPYPAGGSSAEQLSTGLWADPGG